MSTPTRTIPYDLMAYTVADDARRYFTDESIARVLARAESGEQTWAEVYDTIAGALAAKERERNTP